MAANRCGARDPEIVAAIWELRPWKSSTNLKG
jgi:hypothetical protein